MSPFLNVGWICLGMLCSLILSAQPFHDACDLAVVLQAGETLYDQTNRAASTTTAETPEGQPVTCIQSFENDLWYRFESEEAYSWYQITILPYECTTPAGLQALIVDGGSCSSATFQYLDCANPRETQRLVLTVEVVDPQTPFLIYVDGYDGTECKFAISLMGYREDPRSIDDIRQAEMDYGSPPPLYNPESVSIRFQNNVAVIRWEDNSLSDTELFQVQLLVRYSSRSAGTVIGSVEPTQTVGTATTTTYELTDQRGFQDGREYCYRVARIDGRGSIAYSEPVCAHASMIESFWVSDVFLADQADVYQVQYNTRKRQTLRFALLDEEGNELKALEKKREPKGDGIVQISMENYPPGRYELRASGEDGTYKRQFFREP